MWTGEKSCSSVVSASREGVSQEMLSEPSFSSSDSSLSFSPSISSPSLSPVVLSKSLESHSSRSSIDVLGSSLKASLLLVIVKQFSKVELKTYAY